jgi:ATPase subunit of ABC transporter with duplicated ATPase domains
MSTQIILSHLNFSYTSAINILNDITLTFSRGWTTLVGANGSGKTTLLRILAGELHLETKSIRRVPDDMTVQYCAQSVEEMDQNIIQFSESWDGESRRLQGHLQLNPDQLERWDTLSPGERKRWQIGAALAESPDLLLLDEPTNHLDTQAKDLLFKVLKEFDRIGILVSHDRDFLDRLSRSTVKIDSNGSARQFNGNYSSTQKQLFEEENITVEKRDQLHSERKKLKRRIDVDSRSQKIAQSNISPKHRMKSVRDHDARSMAQKGRVMKAEDRLGRSVQLAIKKLERTENDLGNTIVNKHLGRSLFVIEDKSPKNDLIHLKKEAIFAGPKVVLKDVDLLLKREDRIRLHGENGCGKTTLIHEILKSSTLPKDKILYLPQEISTQDSINLLEEANSLPGDIKGRLMQIVAALGVSPDRLMSSELPSPGETRKLKLALGLSRQAWFLILDEPTNHLDLPSIERIEEALINYNGAILLVSHDNRFAQTITDQLWTVNESMLFV